MNSSELQLKKIKETLENCYRNLPDQFALTEVKGNLRKTIDSIQFVEKKRNRRKLQEQQNNMANQLGFTDMESARKALEILDQMIQGEQKIIDNAEAPVPKNSITDMGSDGILLG